ncbi:MAG: TonB-dependent receptor [bacterium]|nr:TonB-dependent receptor [bacterium]
MKYPKFTPDHCTIWCLALLCFQAVIASSQILESSIPDSTMIDSSQSTLINSVNDSTPFRLGLDVDEIADFDYEEFGDLIRVMPGFYPLDQAGYAQPDRALFFGWSPDVLSINFKGRELRDFLLGSPELGWVPPHSLSNIIFQPFAIQAPGAKMDVVLKELQNSPPSSHVGARDGYYGLGNIDFDLAEKITPAVGLNGGGEVSTYGGRQYHSAGYGLNLRAEVVWHDSIRMSENSNRVWGWWGVTQNRRNAQVSFKTASYKRERYETDAVLHWRSHAVRGYGVQQIDTYGSNGEDLWEELGVITQSPYGRTRFDGELKLQAALARWRLKSQNWSTTSFGGLSNFLVWRASDILDVQTFLGLDLSDDFTPARHLGVRTDFTVYQGIRLFLAASQHQQNPSRLEASADYTHSDHYWPYSPVFFQYPSLDVQGTHSLKNETYSNASFGGEIKSRFVDCNLAVAHYRVEDQISWVVDGNVIRSINSNSLDSKGILGSVGLKPSDQIEIGGTGSYLPLHSGEQRIFPEVIWHVWTQYRQPAFQNHLDLRFKVWGDFWGQRWLPVPGGWEAHPNDFVLSARISARLYGVQIFWGVNNILDRNYELLPGFTMMHKEEVWGVSWNFTN